MEEDPADTCRVALEAALDRGLGFCDTEEDRVEVLGEVVGVNDTSFDLDDVLAEGPTDDPLQTRQWVLSRANEIIVSDGDSPLDAINSAWGEVDDIRTSGGSDSDDDPEETEADDDELEDDLEEGIEMADAESEEIVEELTDEGDEAEA